MIKDKRIIITTDFSDSSFAAIKMGIDLSKRAQLPVELLHVLDIPISLNIEDVQFNRKRLEQGVNNLEGVIDYIDEIRDAVSSMFRVLDNVDDDLQIRGHILSNKSPRDLSHFFDTWNAEIVVLGTNGKGESPLIGSFAQRLLSSTSISAINVKSSFQSKFKRVLFASDFTENEILVKAFDKLKTYRKEFQFEIEAVRINTPINFLSTEKINKLFDSFVENCEVDRSRLHSYNAFTVEEGVCSFAEIIQADAIAVFSQGQRGIKKLFHHSFSNHIIQNSDLPVLTIKNLN